MKKREVSELTWSTNSVPTHSGPPVLALHDAQTTTPRTHLPATCRHAPTHAAVPADKFTVPATTQLTPRPGTLPSPAGPRPRPPRPLRRGQRMRKTYVQRSPYARAVLVSATRYHTHDKASHGGSIRGCDGREEHPAAAPSRVRRTSNSDGERGTRVAPSAARYPPYTTVRRGRRRTSFQPRRTRARGRDDCRTGRPG